MAVRRKRSISLPPDLDARVEAAAAAEGIAVSAWLARSAEDRLFLADGLRAMAEWQEEHGEFTAQERSAARQQVARIARRAPRKSA